MNQLKIRYDTSALVLPGRVTEVMDRASHTDLKILLTLCASPELCRSCDDDGWVLRVSEAANCDTDSVKASLAFWRGAGLITVKERLGATQIKTQPEKDKAPTKAAAQPVPAMSDEKQAETPSETSSERTSPKPAKLRPRDELPHYTTEQLATILETHEETAAWLSECQRIFGKMFNTHEVNTILGFVDYLGLDWEYVLCLLAYYVSVRERRGMSKSIKGTETMAYDFYNRGIQTVETLQEEIHRLEVYNETEGKLRTLFGMGERSLTPKEKKCFSTWLYEFGYGMDVIRLAYDVTVDAKGSPNISYMNSVLANWNRDDLRTPEAIKAADEAHRAIGASKNDGKKRKPEPAGSFDTDDFFAAAVRRSFGDDSPTES